MAFNSADIGAFKNVWVFCEQRQGKMMPTTFELISEGRKLADELGVELCGILLGDNVDAIAPELGNYGADKVHIGLDYFDATINRIIAWVVGTRNMQKALLKALLEPAAKLKEMEKNFDNGRKMALLEELKTFPLGAVYDYFCEQQSIPSGIDFIPEIDKYEKTVLSARK